MIRFLRCFVLCLIVSTPAAARAEEPEAPGIELFEKKIRPVLVKHCYKCHASGAKKVHGGLLLDTRAGIRRGGRTNFSLLTIDQV